MKHGVLVLLAAGCYEPEPIGPCDVQCATDVCPGEMACNAEGFCVTPGDDESCSYPGYRNIAGSKSYYRIVTEMGDMVMAAEACALHDQTPGDGRYTHLVVLSNEGERMALVQLPRTSLLTLGHNDKLSEGTYQSVTLEDPTFLPRMSSAPPWAPNEPDAGADCAVLGADLIYAEPCNDERAFLCEADTFENQPSRYKQAVR